MWQIAVFDRGQHQQFRAMCNALVRGGASAPWVLAEHDEPLAATALRMRVESNRLRLDCRGVDGHVECADGAAFWAGKVVELALPALFRIGATWFEVRTPADSVAEQLEPLHREPQGERLLARSQNGPDATTVASWLTSISRLHRLAASSPEFFASAAALTLESTGLDAAMVLTRDAEDDVWTIAGSAVPHPEFGISYDAAALALAYDTPEVWRSPAPTLGSDGDSSANHQQSVVIAPVVSEGEVIAAVYGVRHGQGDNRRRGIRPLEARVIELIAESVGVGMVRRAQEIESARQQVLLEQAFSPMVVEHLRRRPEALDPCMRDVAMLFADLRGFTPLAAKLSLRDAYELLGEVMETLTQAVIDHRGVVIDYYGDGLSALWNAPLDVPDHADAACAAALQMLEALPAVRERWCGRLGRGLELGVGLHAGEVLVGNAGTRRRLKYGPRGNEVNIASRVQAATRRVDVPLLATEAVRRRLSSRFVTLKTCTAKLPGLEEPLELFTVFPATDGHRLQRDIADYAAALAAFERGDLDEAERVLADLLAHGPATPAAFLAQQASALRQSALGRRATDQFARFDEAVIEILAK